MATGKALDGKPYAGNPHVRFDEGEVAPAATSRRGSLLYKLWEYGNGFSRTRTLSHAKFAKFAKVAGSGFSATKKFAIATIFIFSYFHIGIFPHFHISSAALAAPDTAPVEAFKPGSVVVFIGDSITHGGRGGDMNHVYGHSYASVIISRYLGYKPDMDLCFLNKGVSGDSTVTLLARWQRDALEPSPGVRGWSGPFPERKGKLKPDVISLLIGVNDYMSGHEERRTTPEQYAKNLETLVSQTLEALPGCTMVICEPFRLPADTSPDFVARQNAARDVAERHGLCFVEFQRLFSDVLLRENPNAKYWMWDKCHPTAAAHVRMADWWLQTFLKFKSKN